ncbi:MAG: DUF3368 domain-containing protein [Desulfobacteraceae bacterium]|nr:MAG: DUF3368 domain-containing protein [Desulfobacteraceae bacterium]
MKVASNSSPLINLARIGKLDLLRIVFERIIIPEAVWQEVVVEGEGQPGALDIKNANWIEIQAVANKQLVHALRQELDGGEAEAIVLALELQADVLLMDERLGREIAKHFGLRYVGLAGVLIRAKRKGIIDQVNPLLTALRNVAGFRISDGLYQRVLQDAKET